MKKTASFIIQFVFLFLVETVGGIFYHPLGVVTTLKATSNAPRQFVWDGLILMFAAYLVLLAIHALRKRLKVSVSISTIALALAAIVGYLLKIGFVTHNW